MTLSAIIVTYGRPECIRRNLEHLATQQPRPDQVIVVDSSPDEATKRVVEEFPETIYLRHERGLGHTTYSRNLSLQHATGDILAFLDDDAYVRPGWASALQETFADPTVGGVAGRALNGVPGEETVGVDQVGRFTRRGEILGYFAADTGRVVEVDHAIGCNMAIRRDVVSQCGGFREGFSGRYCFREESDIFFMMKRLGYRIVFQPRAVVDHVAAPKPKGRRFDIWYAFYCERNHYILLIRNLGPFAPQTLLYLCLSSFKIGVDFAKGCARTILRALASISGTCAGLCLGTYWYVRQRGGTGSIGSPRPEMVQSQPSHDHPKDGHGVEQAAISSR